MTWNLHIHQDFQLPGPWILHPPHSHCDVPSGPLTLHPRLKPSQRSGMFCCLTAMKLPAALLSTPTLLLIHHASTKQASGFMEKLTVSLGYILIKMSHRSFPSDQIRSDQSLSCVRLFETPWIAARQASLSITNSRSFPKLVSLETVMPSNHLILCRPFSSCPQFFPASRSFQMSQLITSGGQNIGVSASISVLPMNTRTDLL